jgi:hypothetical protein
MPYRSGADLPYSPPFLPYLNCSKFSPTGNRSKKTVSAPQAGNDIPRASMQLCCHDSILEDPLNIGYYSSYQCSVSAAYPESEIPFFLSRCTMLLYKVVEISTVAEDFLEEVLNEWTQLGWRFDSLQFAMRESSRRPSMAFVIFCREEEI